MNNSNDNIPEKSASLMRWHRRIGLLAAALVAILAISGIVLNHREALQLDQRAITTEWLLQWYGMEKDTHSRMGRWISAERIVLDVHSGRILGPAGPYLMDGAAIALLLLAASGIWGWARIRRKDAP